MFVMFGMLTVDVGRSLDGIKVEAERLAGGKPWLSVGGERVMGTWEGAGVGDKCGQVKRFSIGVWRVLVYTLSIFKLKTSKAFDGSIRRISKELVAWKY